LISGAVKVFLALKLSQAFCFYLFKQSFLTIKKSVLMKKLMLIGLVLTVFSVAASAQQASGENFRHRRTEEAYRDGQLTRPEMRRLHKDHQRFEMQKHRAYSDGRFSRRERYRLHRMHRHERREFRHFKHNRHHRHF